jgi:hypothetical protein
MLAPIDGETSTDFLPRCMSDADVLKQFPEQGQRSIACYKSWQAGPSLSVGAPPTNPQADTQ